MIAMATDRSNQRAAPAPRPTAASRTHSQRAVRLTYERAHRLLRAAQDTHEQALLELLAAGVVSASRTEEIEHTLYTMRASLEQLDALVRSAEGASERRTA
jgi:hypothetical protein